MLGLLPNPRASPAGPWPRRPPWRRCARGDPPPWRRPRARRAGTSRSRADSRRLLALTLREALRLGHNYVGTEHILLGLLNDEGTLGTALAGAGVTQARSEELVLEAIEPRSCAGSSG